jgi:phage baseplate assembly protein W
MASRALSIEDGNLNTPSLITSKKVDYKDIDLTFEARPSGDIYKKVDVGAVKQAVKTLLLTAPGEKPFKPNFGAGLGALLFELIDDDAEAEISDAIKIAISNYEPRARVLEVYVNPSPDYNSVEVRVTFQIINTEEVVSFQTSLSRVR